MYKTSHFKHASKAHKLYILLAVATPFAVVAIVWALAADSFFVATYYGVLLVIWVAYLLTSIRKMYKRREMDDSHRPTERNPHRRRNMILERTFWLFILTVSVTSLVWRLHDSASLYLVLASIWAIMVSMGHLLYIGLLTDN